MRYCIFYQLLAICALSLFSSCTHDEPVNPIKPVDERTVLVLTHDGYVFDQVGDLIAQLPNCRFDDVDHWTYGIAKWDYYLYLLDIPNVLKNSGIFPLEDLHDFIPASHALAVSEGKCYVIGYGFGDDNADGHYLPVLYTNYKKEFLPMPGAAITGECHAIYAYDRDHTIIGGFIDDLPAVWVDKEYEIYPVSYPRELEDDEYLLGTVESVAKCNDHIYAAGFEYDFNNKSLATMWTDGVPEHFLSGWECTSSHAVGVHTYGDDVYLLTYEYNNDTDESRTHLWMNGKIIMTYVGMSPAGFTIF